MPSSTMIRRSVATVAVAACAALLSPALAAAEPVAPDAVTLTPPEKTPGNDALKSAIADLGKTAADPVALAAAKALLGNTAQVESKPVADATPAAETADITDIAALIATANETLRTLGIEPFLNPSVAFNCVTPTDANPFGLAAAVGGAAPGPYLVPGLTVPDAAKVLFPDFKTDLVADGETLFGFVPAGITADSEPTGMQVAWFNVNTFKGGFVDMAPVGTTIVDTLLAQIKGDDAATKTVRDTIRGVLTPLANAVSLPGSRLAPVETGNGTVLSAVFGTVQNGDRSCFFLPMIGITQV